MEYNGHPSREHWNVALWVANDEFTYSSAQGLDKDDFASLLMDAMPVTPDGVTVTEELAVYAWECCQD